MRDVSPAAGTRPGLVALLACLFPALILNGAIPFLAVPTLGQAIWTTSFSQSFANGSLLTLHAHNFGFPEPAAMAFGLSGAYPTALFIAAGLHPANAYTVMVALWLTAAFLGAVGIGRRFGAPLPLASLAALVWMTLPVVIRHQGYSMLSIGIALLPLYFLTSLRLFLNPPQGRRGLLLTAGAVLAVCTVSVFMDGYTFMMFAVGSSLLWGWLILREPASRGTLLKRSLPVHVVGFGVAYILYALYIGRLQFSPASLDFFRGWGADVSFWLVPTHGMTWLADVLGLSVARSNVDWFGDASVWTTSFAAPLLLAGALAWWRVRGRTPLVAGLVLVALFGLYMSLGPSLKVLSKRPPELVAAGDSTRLMTAEQALAPTGSAVLSTNLPGFKNMRASYRWVALGLAALWILVVIALGTVRSRWERGVAALGCAFLLAVNLPAPLAQWRGYQANLRSFHRIDADLLIELGGLVERGELVAFLPFRNDFLANYLAARLELRTYNVGGDKNLSIARRSWPPRMSRFSGGTIDPDFVGGIALLLTGGVADVVVLPYIDLLRAAHVWPDRRVDEEALDEATRRLETLALFEVTRGEFFTSVRLRRDEAWTDPTAAERQLLARWCLPPHCLERTGPRLAKLPRQVGRHEAGALHSTGQRGFLVFGPYTGLEAGRYELTVYGEAPRVEGAWLDVVSDSGRVGHAKFPLAGEVTPHDEPHGADSTPRPVLLQRTVTLEETAMDLEVRLFVGPNDEVRLDGYELR